MTDEAEPTEELTLETRRNARIAALPAVYRRNDERMALELVMLDPEADPWEVFQQYGYTRDDSLAVLASPGFTKLLAAARKDVDENGAGFKAKARMQADALLQDSFEIATDPLASAAVRADLIKWTVAVAGYGPKKDDKDDGKGGQGGLNLHITFAGAAQPTAVTHEPITIEADR